MSLRFIVSGSPPTLWWDLMTLALPLFGPGGLDHIGVDGPLGQPTDVGELLGLRIEDVDEGAADDLALLLRVRDPGQTRQEALLGVRTNDLDPHVAGEGAA